MNILVVVGSPKGQSSITLQTAKYLEILHPGHQWTYLHAGRDIGALEKDFSPAEEMVEKADLILFCYPVYTFLVPCQMHRFLELMKEHGISLKGKWASQITTSKHFYDVTAHAFVRDNCFDLGASYVRGLSADMEDLTLDRGRKDAEHFFDYLVSCMEQGLAEEAPGAPEPARHIPASLPASQGEKRGDVVIVADLSPEDRALEAMIARFQAVSPFRTRLINIHDFPFRGGCISCFHCAKDGTCIFKDGFSQLLREKIQTAQAIVLAFTVRDHSMGSVFKNYDDRQFCNGHRTVTMGKPFGYLVSGNLPAEENLRMVLEARAQVGGNFLAGAAHDQENTDESIDRMSGRLTYAIDHGFTQPQNFYGVGGMKIFRDLIWLMQGLMKADHRFYKAHGQYDFPQKKRGQMLAMYLVGAMMGNKKLMAKAGNRMTEGMLAPYTKVLAQARKKA